MAKIRSEDVAEVRERARIDEVVRETVELRPAGGGSFKGLCPFHEERSPSFQVSAAKGLWYCFGCGEGGDTIDFVMRVDALSFAEAVEKLAAKFNVELRYEEGSAAPGRQQGQRTRLVAINRAAADYFRSQLASPEAQIGRDFLSERGFDEEARARFTVGYAPKSWDAVTKHVRSLGFRDEEMLAAGIVSSGQRGVYDRFRGRLVWPIMDLAGDVVGFGARRLYDDDQGPKYLNTPETPLYKKSHVLYGIDLARKDISKQQQAVIVEGYTDVMACHLAGVTTAIATCGTAFGDDHVKVLRRLLLDTDAMSGEVVFTFDGDAAGQRAALKAFDTDQAFVAQTFVAVEADGRDPCELRLAEGDDAVRALIASRVPMFEFAMRAKLAEHDLDTAEGRVGALRETAPLVSSIRDRALRSEYVATLAGWLGMDPSAVTAAVRNQPRVKPRPPAANPAADSATDRPPATGPEPPPSAAVGQLGDPRVERQALQVMLQYPGLVAEWITTTEEEAFTDPGLREMFAAITAVGAPTVLGDDGGDKAWLTEVLAAAEDDSVRTRLRAATVLGLPLNADGDDSDAREDVSSYAIGVMAQLNAWAVTRRIAPLKGRLARVDSGRDPEELSDLMAELMELENYRRYLQDLSLGGDR